MIDSIESTMSVARLLMASLTLYVLVVIFFLIKENLRK